MKLRTLGFRLNPPGPFWFEDLMFFIIDETRQLPARAADAASQVRRLAEKTAAFARDVIVRRPVPLQSEILPTAAPRHVEVAPLDEPETWYLATEPLLSVRTGTQTAIALHKAATEQLDALTYAMDRIRDDLRPIMIHARLPEETTALHEFPSQTALDANIEALLELSRQNAATRPNRRIRSVA